MYAETNSDRELILLEQIEHDPDVTQASLAALLGVAVGTVNWHIKRFIAKGYVKVKRAQRRKLRYIITPEGLAFRAHLTVHYIETSMRLYRKTRQQVRELLCQIVQKGQKQIYIEGEGDIADICRLTCLELGIQVIDHHRSNIIQDEPATIEALAPENTLATMNSPMTVLTLSPVSTQVTINAPAHDSLPVLEVHGTRVNLRLKS